jgi:nitrite reductase/ring-hydroxylating ferredoxin subunit
MVAKTTTSSPLQSHHHVVMAALLVVINYILLPISSVEAFSSSLFASTCKNAFATTSSTTESCLRMVVAPPPGGIALEDDNVQAATTNIIRQEVVTEIAEPSPKRVGINSRGAKMNEINFTLAPSDVSLSRCYQMAKDNNQSSAKEEQEDEQQQSESSAAQSLSLTRALNTASNRAVRRILLARSWPSAEALNLSLRTVLMQQQQQQQQFGPSNANSGMGKQDQVTNNGEEENDKMKCPVPRPILNILVKNRRTESDANNSNSKRNDPTPRTSKEREEQWIANQIAVFRESYNTTPGYDQAEAYLESILVLATSGVESDRVKEVFEGGVYVEPYRRVLSVIQSVGAVLEQDPTNRNKKRIAKKLIDQDFCLSMLDKVTLSNEKKQIIEHNAMKQENPLAVPYDAAARLAYEADENNKSLSFEEFKQKYEAETVAMVAAKKSLLVGGEVDTTSKEEEEEVMATSEEPKGAYEKGRKRRLFREFWSKLDNKAPKDDESTDVEEKNDDDVANVVETKNDVEESSATPTIVIKPDDLGGVLLSAEEPTMTRQLNVLSNIVERTLIFGGDQELLVLAETLDADKPAFIQRWYSNDQGDNVDVALETRPGVQYLNALIRLLRDCYAKGVLKDIRPVVPLTNAYMNAYARLTASLVELGSDYIRPSSSNMLPLTLTTTAAAARYITSSAPPKSARDELDRFAKWESTVRKNYDNNQHPYPDDLIGTWDVQDVVGGSIIGSTKVDFRPQGEVNVKPPMQGLRWRLDPGPTHLDTCTFQVLSDDGAILQYKGFVDRGSRLEARVSKRSVTMRGSVSFLMRDADGGGGDDMLPINYKSGLTKFVMSREVNGDASASVSYSAEVTLTCPAVAEGEREIIDGPIGPILVTKVAGAYYAVDAKCPHLNLPMKKGKISNEGGVPTLTCNFHNSCFEMKSGKCTKWVTGALGNENELIGGIMSSVGSEKKDIVAYSVSEAEDGTLIVTSQTEAS